MSIGTLSLYESLLRADRPLAWWGLDTADPLVDDTGHGYDLTVQGAPANAVTLIANGDGGSSGCRNFNGSSDAYWTAGTIEATADAPPRLVGSLTSSATSSAAIEAGIPEAESGDLVLAFLAHSTATATISSAPAGWTQVGSTTNHGHGASAVYKRLPSTVEYERLEGWTWSTSGTVSVVVVVYRGADPDVSGLVFDSGVATTSSGQSHASSSETWPAMSRSIVAWNIDSSAVLTPYAEANGRAVATVQQGNLKLHVYDYAEEQASGSRPYYAWTSSSTTAGAWVITVGAAPKVLESRLDELAAGAAIHAVVNPDTVVGFDNVVRKYQSWGLWLNAGVVTFGYRDGAGTDRTVTGPTLSAGVTAHLVVWDDGTDIHFLVNGSHTTSSRVGTAGYTTNANRVTIGAVYTGSYSDFFDGRIDEVAIFDAMTLYMAGVYYTAHSAGTFGTARPLGARGASFYPTVAVEVAWGSDPADNSLAWQDVTSYWRDQASTRRGRNFEIDRMETGRADVSLDNRTRAFDPAYTSSPFYPGVLPARPIRIRAQAGTGNVAHRVFFGYLEGWPLRRPHYGHDAIVTLVAADAQKALALDKVAGSAIREAELPGERLEALLGALAGLEVVLDPGRHVVVGDDLDGMNRLDHAQQVVETDGGVFFADGEGRLVFQDAHNRTLNERTVRETFSDQPTGAELQLGHQEPALDEARLFTTATITPPSGNPKTSANDAAVAAYWARTKELNTLHESENDAQAMAEGWTNRYSTPRFRIPSVDVYPTDLSTWEAVLALELSHRIRTIEHPVGGGTVTRDHFVEGVSHTIGPDGWRVSLSVSPAELEDEVWLLGTGELGDTVGLTATILGW